jgi:hypothetical protein
MLYKTTFIIIMTLLHRLSSFDNEIKVKALPLHVTEALRGEEV